MAPDGDDAKVEKDDMKLIIQVQLTGSQNRDGSWSLKPTYKLIEAKPASPGVLADDGSIDLTKMAFSGEYNKATLITFALDSKGVTDRTGKPAIVKFRSPNDQAVRFGEVLPASASRADSPARPDAFSPPAHLPGMDDYILMFSDSNRDGKTYSYCLTVICSEAGASAGTEVPLDPRIVNRPDS